MIDTPDMRATESTVIAKRNGYALHRSGILLQNMVGRLVHAVYLIKPCGNSRDGYPIGMNRHAEQRNWSSTVWTLIVLTLVICTHGVAAQAPEPGTIRGTIRYLGAVPAAQRVTLTDGQVILHNDIVVHPKAKGLRDVIVILDWKAKIAADAKAKPVLIDQRDMLFVPRVVTVQEGRKVRFENNDLYNHAVSAQSVHPENVFNVTTPSGQPFEHAFKAQKNPITIGCVLHSWMRAYVQVVPHPYHDVTNAEGQFRIAGVPAGKHTLQLIHPDTNFRASVQVEVSAGKTVEVPLEWKSLKE